MTPRDRERGALMRQLAALGAADRRAVLRHLSAEEQTLVRRMLTLASAATRAPPSAPMQLAGCSAWFTRRVLHLARNEDRTHLLTPTCHEALQSLLQTRRVSSAESA